MKNLVLLFLLLMSALFIIPDMSYAAVDCSACQDDPPGVCVPDDECFEEPGAPCNTAGWKCGSAFSYMCAGTVWHGYCSCSIQCETCTPNGTITCSPDCPTACGYGGGTISTCTNSCGAPATKSCPATGACCTRDCEFAPADKCIGVGITDLNNCTNDCPSGSKGPTCPDPAGVCLGTIITSTNECNENTCIPGTSCSCPSGTKCDTPTIANLVPVPSDGATFSNVDHVDINWSNMTTDWNGAGSCGEANRYEVCVGTNSVDPCSGGTVAEALAAGPWYVYSQSAAGTYYWKVRAKNNCLQFSNWSSIKSFSILQAAKDCFVTLSASGGASTDPVTVSLTGSANSTYGDSVRLWVAKADKTQLSPNNISPAAVELVGAAYYYHIGSGDCNSLLSSCSKSTAVTLPTGGNYIIYCDVPTDPKKCSGNPFCSMNGGTFGCDTIAGGSWANCNGVYSQRGGDNEAYCSDGGPYLSGWNTWGACSPSPTKKSRTRTRTCTQDCTNLTTCSDYFANNCPTGSTCTVSVAGSTWTQTETQKCYGDVTGTLFDATGMSACPADPQTLSADLKISGATVYPRLNGTIVGGLLTTDINGRYATDDNVLSSPNTLTFSIFPPGEFNVTPKFNCQGTSWAMSGSSSSCMTQPCETATYNFGFEKVSSGWWQVVNGSVYGGTGITSKVPGSLPGGAANQRLILSGTGGADGLAYLKTGTIELGTNPNATISNKGWNVVSGYSGADADYYYFKTKMATFSKLPWNGTSKPPYDGTNGYDVYVRTGVGDISWDMTAGEKVIYLVDGDVTISGNIAVPKTSPTFFAVIASGSITFNSSVTAAQGWFVGSTLNFPTSGGTDSQFKGEGSFIGWNGISLGRTMGAGNNTTPAEEFTFRPDLLINAPEPILISKYVWRQL